MKTLQLQLRVGDTLSVALAPLLDFDPDLVLCFGDPHFFRDPAMHLNGSALVQGLQATLEPAVRISGGLAGDGGAFVETFTLGAIGSRSDQIVAVGLYGAGLDIGNSTFGGWVPFGPARRVTRCD